MRRLRSASWLLAVVLLCLAASALARVGGGQQFSGGHSSSHSSGGGGDDSGLISLVFWLLLSHPVFGVPVLIIAALIFISYARQRSSQSGSEYSGDDSTDLPSLADQGAGYGRIPPRVALRKLVADDPAFSLPLFEDFLNQLYTQTQELRGTHKLDALTPYLAEPVRKGLATVSASLTEVKDVIVGGLTIVGVQGLEAASPRVKVGVRLETNVTEVSGAQASELWLVEEWTLERKRTAKSRPKGELSLLRCPSCGAPFESGRGAVCSYCRQTVDTGDFDWVVTQITELERLHKLAPEAGGRPPIAPRTIVDSDAQQGLEALSGADAAFDWQAFAERVGLIFGQLQVAWSSLAWLKARPYVTDALYNSQLYWVQRYQKQHQRNVTEGATLQRIELASCVSDVAYDSITIRLWAEGLDYTVDEATGKVVEGSKTARQAYSEYWTFLRSRGVSRPASGQPTCPSCGAPISVTMAGDCTHCRAHLTSGDFDWVLSRIEQDSAYG